MVLTNQLIYLTNVKTMRIFFSNYVYSSEKLNFTSQKFKSWTDSKGCDSAMEETLQHFKALDVLINNAGMMHTENLQKLTGNILIFQAKI